MASFSYNGETYELPKKTLAIVRKEDAMVKPVNSLEERYKKQYDYAITVLGEENFKKIFESDSFNEIDFSLLTFICNEIDTAYMQIIYDQQKELQDNLMSGKGVDRAIKLGNSMQTCEKYNKK